MNTSIIADIGDFIICLMDAFPTWWLITVGLSAFYGIILLFVLAWYCRQEGVKDN
jgi:uncharacterized membrane protein